MGKKYRVVAIDDDKTLVRMVAMIFEKAGYEVFTALNGREGLETVIKVKPDLVVLDVMMPDMSGLEVCRHLRSNPETALLPIIMLSAKGQVEDKVSGFEAGADDYVQKPVAPKELLARAHALLQRVERAKTPAGRIISVVGAKGGVGVTTVAINIAVGLAERNHSVVLAELRPYHGTAAYSLHLMPTQTLESLLEMDPHRIHQADVSRRLLPHDFGIRLLSAPQHVSQHPLTEAHTNAILDGLTGLAEFVVVDLPHVYGEASRRTLERSNLVFLVTEPELLSLASARADLETFKTWGVYDRSSLVIVARTRSNALIKPSDIKQQLDARVAAFLPPAPEAFHLAVSTGKPVVVARPDDVVGSTMLKLVDMVEKNA